MDQFTSLFSSSSSSKPSHHSEDEKPDGDGHGHGENTSPGDLMGSAQYIFGAAKSKLQHGKGQQSEVEDVDTGRLAGAAADVLDAAQRYGKLEGSKYGEYIQKAEDYLEGYGHKQKGGGAPAHGRLPPSSSEETQYEEHNTHGRQEVQHGKHSSEESHSKYGKEEEDYSEESDNKNEESHSKSGKEEEDYSEEGDNKYAKYFQKAQEYFNK